jgi:hypothetical protein
MTKIEDLAFRDLVGARLAYLCFVIRSLTAVHPRNPQLVSDRVFLVPSRFLLTDRFAAEFLLDIGGSAFR